jgi:isovaleryl-CoA dehydrogenase
MSASVSSLDACNGQERFCGCQCPPAHTVKIVDMYTSLQSARAYAYMVAQDYDKGYKSRIDPASCLLHASTSAVQVALEAIQCLGGNGYINEYPTGRILRDAKLYEIGAGTNEIRRMLIGRELFHGKW